MKIADLVVGTPYVTSDSDHKIFLAVSTATFGQYSSRYSGPGTIRRLEKGQLRNQGHRYGVLAVEAIHFPARLGGAEAEVSAITQFAATLDVNELSSWSVGAGPTALEQKIYVDGQIIHFRITVKAGQNIESTLADYLERKSIRLQAEAVRAAALNEVRANEERQLTEVKALLGVDAADTDTIYPRGAGRVSVDLSDLLALVRRLTA